PQAARRAWALLYALDPKNALFVRLLAAIELEVGKPVDAERLARESLALAPGGVEAALVLARALVAQERLAEAQALAEELLRRLPRHAGVLFQAGEIYDLQRQFQRSLPLYDRLVVLDPQDARFGRRRAETLFELGYFEDAIREWGRLIGRAPPDGDSLRALGRVYWAVQAYDQAWEHWERLARQRPDDPAVLVLVANVQLARGRVDEALRLSKRVLELAPGDPDGSLILARALARAGRKDEARQVLEAFVRSSPDRLAARFQMAELLAEMGLHPEALAQYDALLKRKPGHPPYRRLRAQVLFNMGKRRAAIEEWRALADARPPDVPSLASLAWGYAGSGEPARAIESAERLTALEPEGIGGLVLLSTLTLDFGEPKAAASAAERALAVAPGDRDATVALARALLALGRASEARDRLRTLLPRHRNHPAVLFYLSEVELGEERAEEALPLLDRLATLVPDQPLYLRRRGDALYALGRFDEAVAQWRASPADMDAGHRLVADALARRDWDGVVSEVERLAGLGVLPPEAWSRLAFAQLSAGRALDALKAAEQAEKADPAPMGPRLLKAEALEVLGRYAEAEAIYEKLLRANPHAERSALALVRLAEARGDHEAAARLLARTRRRLPWPQLAVREARLRADAGSLSEALRLARQVESESVPGLTVLSYAGLSRFGRGEGASLKTFREHLRALKAAGYRPVTPSEALKREAPPKRSVLVTVEDASARTLEAADEVLREVGWKATLFAHLGDERPGRPSTRRLRELEAGGRWEIQSHGVLAHEPVAVDSGTRTGRFLTNRLWLAAAGRLETEAELRVRVERELERARAALEDSFPGRAACFGFPAGDFGQSEDGNHPGAAPLNRAAVARRFDLAFASDPWGYNGRVERGGLLRRFQVPGEWSGRRLVAHLDVNEPRVQALLLAGDVHLAAGSPRKALRLYARLEREGLDAPQLWAQKGLALERMGLAYGAYQHYARAYKLDPETPRYRELLLGAQLAIGPRVEPRVSGFSDSFRRTQSKALLRFGTSLEATQLEAWGGLLRSYELNAPGVESRETGAQVRVPIGMTTGAELRFARRSHRLMAEATDATGRRRMAGRLRESDAVGLGLDAWLSPVLRAEVGFDAEDLEGAVAILNGRRLRRQRAGLDWDLGQDWGASLAGELRGYNDGNRERATRLNLARRLSDGLYSVGYTFSHSDARRESPDYYSPLRLNQHLVAVAARPGDKTLRGLLQAAAGYGFQDAGKRFVQSLRGGLQWRLWDRLLWTLDGAYSRAPTYVSREFNMGMTLAF
ncbi:MAG: tetratricopeptide repeat protein, partial [Elusimicrobia bacterium]|nr:tetratricopeptide repeat protein [Elusimicrobiota bacterium]